MATALTEEHDRFDSPDFDSRLLSLKLDLTNSNLPRNASVSSSQSTSCSSRLSSSAGARRKVLASSSQSTLCSSRPSSSSVASTSASSEGSYTELCRDTGEMSPLTVTTPAHSPPVSPPPGQQPGGTAVSASVPEQESVYEIPQRDRYGRLYENAAKTVSSIRSSPLEAVLPPAPPLTRREVKKDVAPAPPEALGILASIAAWFCASQSAAKASGGAPSASRKTWYKVIPSSPGPDHNRFNARMVGPEDVLDRRHPQQRKLLPQDAAVAEQGSRSRSLSFPATLERGWDIDRGYGYSKNDIVDEDLCNICYANAAQVVMLPCKHGRICETCFRRSVFMRPVHRGGRTCPFCRKYIQKAVVLDKEEVKKHSSQWRYGVVDEL